MSAIHAEPISIRVSKAIVRYGFRVGDFYKQGVHVGKDFQSTDVIAILSNRPGSWYADLILPKDSQENNQGDAIWILNVYGVWHIQRPILSLVRDLQNEFGIHIDINFVSDIPKEEFIPSRTPAEHVIHTIQVAIFAFLALALLNLIPGGSMNDRTILDIGALSLGFGIMIEITVISNRHRVPFYKAHGLVQWFWNIINQVLWIIVLATISVIITQAVIKTFNNFTKDPLNSDIAIVVIFSLVIIWQTLSAIVFEIESYLNRDK